MSVQILSDDFDDNTSEYFSGLAGSAVVFSWRTRDLYVISPSSPLRCTSDCCLSTVPDIDSNTNHGCIHFSTRSVFPVRRTIKGLFVLIQYYSAIRPSMLGNSVCFSNKLSHTAGFKKKLLYGLFHDVIFQIYIIIRFESTSFLEYFL